MTRRLRALLYLAAVALLIGTVWLRLRWERLREAREYHRRGVAALQRGNLPEAVEAFQREVALTPHNPLAYASLGMVEKERGRYPQAARALRKALELGADDVEIDCALGFIFYRMTQYQAAVPRLKRCIRRQPDDDRSRYYLTQCYLSQGMLDDAEREIRVLIDRHPQTGQFHYVLGAIYMARSASPQNNDAAARSLRTAIAFDKNLTGAYYSLGIVYRRMNRLAEAAQMLEEALRRDPGGYEIRRVLASVYRQMGNHAAAREQFRRVRADMQKVRYSQRLDYLRGEALLRNPQNPVAHYQLGCFYLETNELNKAAAALQTAAQLDPTWTEVHEKLAQVYERLGKRREAEQARQRATRRARTLRPPE
ncbi:MAG: tetratricopeptide repeat protein [Abditibacteriales bacterium]|nr:tetratricopeptide repeat protein [Abditibacteriales bacterium]MDW8366002.1 tetratricopeptide repeat protein [Abditibacteriales bacterium]